MNYFDEFRDRFARAVGGIDTAQRVYNTTAELSALTQLTEKFKVGCLALLDNLRDRRLPGYPVVIDEGRRTYDERAFLIGCWTDEDEDGDPETSFANYTLFTYVLLTNGIVTQSRWLAHHHAFLIEDSPDWLALAVRPDFRSGYRLVSARTPFDCGDLIEHLTYVAVAGGQFYAYGSEVHLLQGPGDTPVAWDR